MRLSVLVCIFASACTGIIDVDTAPPPPKTDVQIVIRDGQSPQPGVAVIFQGVDGSLVAEATTDATGAATAELPEGGSVTVIRSYPTPTGGDPLPIEVYTYAGVKSGDRLALGRPASEQGTASAVLVKVPTTAGGTVKIQSPCGGGQGTGPLVAITVRDCAPEIGLYVVDGAQQSFFKRTTFSENMDVSNESLVGALASPISATNVPPNTVVTVEQRLGYDGFYFFSTGAKRVDTTPANTNVPPLSGVEQLVITSSSSNNRTQVVASRGAYNQDSLIVDASAGLIASVSGLSYKPTGITWVEEGGGTADAVIASLDVTRADLVNNNRQYVRMIIAPHTGASLQVPVLPGTGAIYNPKMGDQVATSLGIVAATGGYDAVRARAFAVPSVVDATPLDGRITLSYAGSAPGI